MRLQIPDQQLQVSRRLPLGILGLALASAALLWPLFHAWSLLAWIVWAPAFILTRRYAAGSWIRVSMQRGISWCLVTPLGKRLGSVELDAAAIRGLDLKSNLLGQWDLQLLGTDGRISPRLRFFQDVLPLAEALHAYLQQNADRQGS